MCLGLNLPVYTKLFRIFFLYGKVSGIEEFRIPGYPFTFSPKLRYTAKGYNKYLLLLFDIKNFEFMFRKILYLGLLSLFLLCSGLTKRGGSFADLQLRNYRVAVARKEKDSSLKQLCRAKGLNYPYNNIFIRIFKREAELEVWSKNRNGNAFTFIKTYKICMVSGKLGPKREEGDLQTPEGFYQVVDFNPNSNFYLSLGINYPNTSDRIKTTNKMRPGGSIYIHGSCVSIGCIPIGDDGIKELYWLAVQAKAQGQPKINVHIFPFRMNTINMNWAQDYYKNNQAQISFWKSIKPGYDYFEENKTLNDVRIDKNGNYFF
jgi:murein L,D-transpeptidase YafK